MMHVTDKLVVMQYRAVAARGAMLFFLLNSLNKIHAFYQYSLNAFVTVFSRAIDVAPGRLLPCFYCHCKSCCHACNLENSAQGVQCELLVENIIYLCTKE